MSGSSSLSLDAAAFAATKRRAHESAVSHMRQAIEADEREFLAAIGVA